MARGIGSSSKASALVGLAILVGSLEVSSAATLVQTENFGPVPDGNASVRFFDLFDPSLGTLTSARYFLTSTIDDKLGVTVTTILSFLGSSVTAEFQLVHLPPTPLDFGGPLGPLSELIGMGGFFNGGFAAVFSYSSNCITGCGTGWSGHLDVTYNYTPSPSAVPLPAAAPLFATGLGALGLLGSRKKKKAAALGA